MVRAVTFIAACSAVLTWVLFAAPGYGGPSHGQRSPEPSRPPTATPSPRPSTSTAPADPQSSPPPSPTALPSSTPSSQAPKHRGTSPSPSLRRDKPAWHGAEAPLTAPSPIPQPQQVPTSTAVPAPARATGRLAARWIGNPRYEQVSGMLIYSGAGALALALGGLLLVGVQRRRW